MTLVLSRRLLALTCSASVAVGIGAVTLTGCARDLGPQVAVEIEKRLDAARPAAVPPETWTNVRRFYEARMFAPRWVRDGEPGQASAVLRTLQRAPDHGLSAGDYADIGLQRVLAPSKTSIEEALDHDVARIAQLDVRVTAALLALGRDVAVGRVTPAVIDARWTMKRTPPDLAGTLAEAADADRLDGWLDAVRPIHPEYAALQRALADLRAHPGEDGDDRASRLALNLERWRWVPDDLGETHILVNVPAFEMALWEHGRPAVAMKVIVGKPDRQTPLFNATMETIVFSPYWNVPDSIAEGETAPAAARDPHFLTRNHIEILRRSKDGVSVVDPSSIDWQDPEAIKPLAFRQQPGPGNALGHVKFLFPNQYDVYLHDTPADALFARTGRALSHGCVRLEKPDALANYLLRDDPEWDETKIQTAMHQDEEKHVALKRKLPVYIVYFTAGPDGAGGVVFWPDVYGYDAKQSGSQAASLRAAVKLD